MGRKIIKAMRLDEISSVDRPAQTGALYVIAKRAEQPQPLETQMFKTRAELEAAIAKFLKDGGTQADIVNIRKSATALSATDAIPADSVLREPATVDPAEVTALREEVTKMGKLSNLTPAQRAIYDKMNPADQTAYLMKSAEDLAKALDTDIAKAAESDPVVHTCLDGTLIRKSTGDVVLALAKRADENERQLAAERASRQDEQLAKRAKEELSNLPGDETVHKAVLRALDGISDPTQRASAFALLKAGNEAVGGVFAPKGTSGEGPVPAGQGTVLAKGAKGEAEQKLNDLAKKYEADHKVKFTDAYSEVLKTAEGRQLYAAYTAA